MPSCSRPPGAGTIRLRQLPAVLSQADAPRALAQASLKAAAIRAQWHISECPSHEPPVGTCMPWHAYTELQAGSLIPVQGGVHPLQCHGLGRGVLGVRGGTHSAGGHCQVAARNSPAMQQGKGRCLERQLGQLAGNPGGDVGGVDANWKGGVRQLVSDLRVNGGSHEPCECLVSRVFPGGDEAALGEGIKYQDIDACGACTNPHRTIQPLLQT